MTDEMRLYFLEEGFHEGNLFHTEIDVNHQRNLEDFLIRSQKFIDHKKRQLASQAVERSANEKNVQNLEGRQNKEQGYTTCEHCPCSNFALLETDFAECISG